MSYYGTVTDSTAYMRYAEYTRKQSSGASETSFDKPMNEAAGGSEGDVKVGSAEDILKEKGKNLVSKLETMETIMADLEASLDGLFKANNIEKDPPLEFHYNESDNEIVVSGDREDIRDITELVNSDPELKAEMKESIEKAQNLAKLAENVKKYQEYLGSLEGPLPEVGLSYGMSTAFTVKSAETEDKGEEAGEVSGDKETNEIFERIKELMLMTFIQLDPEEEEKKKSAKADDNGASDEAAKTDKENNGANEFAKLKRQIEAARQDALAMYGTDKNKYSMAIESYTIHMKDEETKTGLAGQQQEEVSEEQSVGEPERLKA